MYFRDHLEKVRYFQAVCDAGTFRRAAETLHLSQSSLTVAVKKLEDSVGHRLLIRTKRGVRPTTAGETLLGFARDLSFRVEDLEARLRAPAGSVSGRLRIGAYDSIAIYWLPRVLGHLRRTFPPVSLAISVGSSASLIDRVRSGDIDIAVVVAPPKDDRLHVEQLFYDQFSFFGTQKTRRAWANQSSAFLIGMFNARIKGGLVLGDVVRGQGLAVVEALEVESFEIAKSLALQDVGIALLPHRVAEFGAASKRLTAVRGLPKGIGRHGIGLVTQREAGSKSGLAALVCREMRAVL